MDFQVEFLGHKTDIVIGTMSHSGCTRAKLAQWHVPVTQPSGRLWSTKAVIFQLEMIVMEKPAINRIKRTIN